VSFAVTAVGTAPLSYQWQTNGMNLVNGGRLSGATNATLTITNAQLTDSESYTVIVTNLVGSVTSSPAAMLTVLSSPVILVQPSNQWVAVGATATLAVTAIGVAPLSYQWLKDGVPLANYGDYSGVTTNMLTISDAQTNYSGQYKVVVTNILGSVNSSNAVLTVTNVPPAIIVQPTNQTVGMGSTVTFAVTATGTAPLSYQWQDGTNLLVDGGQINGAISNVLTISNVQLTNNGNYTVTITNLVGSVTSSNAVLTVIGAPRFGSIIVAGGTNGGFILSGVGGTNNGTYYVLMSSNLLTPLTNWTRIATNQFDNLGGFIFTNAAQTNAPQEFYILQMP
jgi:hypothetical protein